MNKNRPVYEKKIGNVRGAVFQQEHQGRTWWNVSVVRRYKEGDVWRDASTFNGLSDLCHLAKVVECVTAWLERQEDVEPIAAAAND